MEELYAKEHDGRNLWGHLSETVFVLANNYWETSFRMIETGLDIPPARPGNDADGLDLEPRPSSTGWFKEYFDVLPKGMDKFLDVYRNNTLAVMKSLAGYEGVTFVTTLPPGKAEATRSKYRGVFFPLAQNHWDMWYLRSRRASCRCRSNLPYGRNRSPRRLRQALRGRPRAVAVCRQLRTC
ncbi:MAG: hypothetical protein WD795_08835 [Woeseia sp.]